MYIDHSFERFICEGEQKNGVIEGKRCDFINGRNQVYMFSDSIDF